MIDAIQAVVDREEITVSDESVNGAAQIISLAVGRDRFSYNRLLPPDLAAAIELINQEDPADALTATLIFLVGMSGLLKLGTRVRLSARYSVPCNMFLASIGPTGLSKTGHTTKLIDEPSTQIRLDAMQHYQRELEHWQELCKAIKRKEDRPEKPLPLFPHQKQYTPEALNHWLPHYEKRKLGCLIKREELSSLHRAIDSDTKRGRGTAEGQFLELFDGAGNTSIGVEAGARHCEKSHVSVFGNIQPDALAELINGKDATGKFARFLCIKVPLVCLNLRDEDETEEEEAALEEARQLLAKYANELFKLPPKTYVISSEGRAYYNAWWRRHNLKALDPTTHKVIQALYGKAGAHALRVAGILHLVWSLVSDDLDVSVVSLEQMKLATEIVDQCLQETELFHNQPADRTHRYMQHINKFARETGSEVTYKKCRAAATWKGGRSYKTADFARCVERLCDQGFGEKRMVGQSLTYRSLRLMPGDNTDKEKQGSCQPKTSAVQSVSKKRRF